MELRSNRKIARRSISCRADRFVRHCSISHDSFTRRNEKKKGEMRMTQVRKTATYRVVTDSGGDRIFLLLLRLLRRTVLREQAHPGGHGGSGAGDRVGTGGQVGVQLLPQMREVCLLRYVQCQRGTVSGLRAVGGRVPFVLPSRGARLRESDTASAPSAGEAARWAAQTERRKPNDRLRPENPESPAPGGAAGVRLRAGYAAAAQDLPQLRQGQQRRPDGLHRLRRASARDDSL